MALRRQKLTNSALAELLAQAGEKCEAPLNRAYNRAARSAFLWPVSAAELVQRNEPLTLLEGVGPFLEKQIRDWVRNPPRVVFENESRINFLTITEARKVLEAHPAWLNGVKGDLQMHTEWSDGENSVAEMADAGLNRGYHYIAITDHAKSLKIAGGIDEQALEEQAREIAGVNSRMVRLRRDFRVLRSIELNLRPDGTGDMDSKALRKLDIVIGAFHSALRKTEDQTSRYLAALKNPQFHILAHPRGRVYNHRPGLNADWERVCGAAAERGKALEVDCYADRQDLDVERLQIAKQSGVTISLGSDSHHSWQMDFIELGLAALCLVNYPKDRILNFKTRAELLSWAGRSRR